MSACKYCGNTAEYERGFRAGIESQQAEIARLGEGTRMYARYIEEHGRQADEWLDKLIEAEAEIARLRAVVAT